MKLRGSVLLILVSLMATACGPTKKAAGPTVAAEPPPHTYVAIGASESVGFGADSPLRDGWTKLFWTKALPAGTSFNNIAIAGSTTSQAAASQLPLATSLQPDYVTVWLNVNDIVDGVSPAEFQTSLAQILSGLHNNTKAKVLVANTPPLDQMPAYLNARNGQFPPRSPFANRDVPTPAQLNATVDQYNSIAAKLVAANADTLVDLHALGQQTIASGTAASLYASDGFHPSNAGHAAVAGAFESAFSK